MVILQYVLAILGFSIIILVHEFGHFIAARLSKMHVLEFFIGFGPKVIKFKSKKSGTMYGLSAVPLGGYNKILGFDRSENVPEALKDKVFYNKPFYKKFFVISGGGIFNIIFTVFLIVIYLSMGIYAPTNVIDFIQPDSPAETYGFNQGDEVIALNDHKIASWEDFSTFTKSYPGKEVTYTVIRGGKELEIEAKLNNVNNEGFLGVGPRLVKVKMNFFQIVKESFIMTGTVSVTYMRLFGMLLAGKIPFSEARPTSPIGIISIFQQSAAMGFQNFILFVALVSLLLAFGNFLPILPVDGGHLVIIIIESLRKKPVSKKALEIYNTIGIVLVVSLLLIGFIFDIISPFKLPSM
ncbi:MAG: site-2 protease family protein [Actinobacteria bacterium]|nr:site-2 protease family protein [Actinomycetota bacterium]MBM3712874.1 site-2 protease family protein [Actinomycetota bacterium]